MMLVSSSCKLTFILLLLGLSFLFSDEYCDCELQIKSKSTSVKNHIREVDYFHTIKIDTIKGDSLNIKFNFKCPKSIKDTIDVYWREYSTKKHDKKKYYRVIKLNDNKNEYVINETLPLGFHAFQLTEQSDSNKNVLKQPMEVGVALLPYNHLPVLIVTGDREFQLPQNKSSTTIDLKSAAKAYDYEDGELAVEWYADSSASPLYDYDLQQILNEGSHKFIVKARDGSNSVTDSLQFIIKKISNTPPEILICDDKIMNIDLKQANNMELKSYQIALLKVIIDCNSQLAKIKAKLNKLESKKDE